MYLYIWVRFCRFILFEFTGLVLWHNPCHHFHLWQSIMITTQNLPRSSPITLVIEGEDNDNQINVSQNLPDGSSPVKVAETSRHIFIAFHITFYLLKLCTYPCVQGFDCLFQCIPTCYNYHGDGGGRSRTEPRHIFPVAIFIIGVMLMTSRCAT